jgi:hypothetical protein
MDVQIYVNEDINLFFAKLKVYKKVKKRFREQAKKDFIAFYEHTKAKHKIKDLLFKT